MLTARVYDAVISKKIQSARSESEDTLMRHESSQYLPDVAKILQQVPRELILVLKTNDLARSVENILLVRTARLYCTFNY